MWLTKTNNRENNMTPKYFRNKYFNNLDKYFDNVLGDFSSIIDEEWQYPVNKYWTEKDGVYKFEVDVPGVDPNAVKVTTSNKFLNIDYTRKDTKYNKKLSVYDTMDLTKVDVCLKLGVLTVSVPKKEAKEAVDSEIPVRVE